MPNWVKNTLTIKFNTPEEKAKCLELLFSEEEGSGKKYLDFNHLVPMPKELMDCTCGSDGELGLQILNGMKTIDELQPHNKKRIDEILAAGHQYKSNLRKYGSTTWYDWSVKHWGTKWNADTEYIDLSEDLVVVVRYTTPWEMPNGWLCALATRLPEVYWVNDADEEGGFFAGTLTHPSGDCKLYWEEHESHYWDDLDDEE